jgi:phage baseplate assembly protein W
MDNIYKTLIGTGMLFPIEITKNSDGKAGWYPVEGDTKLIENNLEAVFLHQIGIKFREEEFGSRIWECLEEQNTQAQAYVINQFMRDAFESWEERIVYKGTTLTREGSKLNIVFTYQINGNSSSKTGTLVYDSSTNTLNT